MSDEIDRAELERRHREACDLLLAAQEQLARLSDSHTRALREVEIARSDTAAMRLELAAAELAAADLRAQLDGVLGSASWQLTRPLRGLKGRVRR